MKKSDIGTMLITLAVSAVLMVILMSCEQDFDDVKYQTHEYGKIQIDSTQFKPVLMKVDGNTLIIVEKEGIKEIKNYDMPETFFVGFLIGVVFFGLVLIWNELK